MVKKIKRRVLKIKLAKPKKIKLKSKSIVPLLKNKKTKKYKSKRYLT